MRRINQIEPWIGEEEKRAVIEYLDSGGWLTEYERTKQFERMIAEYIGCKYASVVSSGTAALALALMALGLKNGDEVIVPDFTMIASANAVLLSRARPVLVDISKQNLCLDLELARKAVTPRTKAVILVSLNGRSPGMEAVLDFCRENDLFLVEDAAQSLGSRYRARHLGTFGDIGCLSFSFPKIITTGQGGAVLTDNSEIYQKVAKLKDFGRPVSGVDYHETVGFNFKFTDLQAVIGIEQLRKLEWRVERKKEIYRVYQELLQGTGLEFIHTDLQETTPWFVDVLVKERRDSLSSFLDERGIRTRPFHPAIHSQPPYSHVKGNFPIAEYASRKGLWLPSSLFLGEEDIRRICAEIQKYFKSG